MSGGSHKLRVFSEWCTRLSTKWREWVELQAKNHYFQQSCKVSPRTKKSLVLIQIFCSEGPRSSRWSDSLDGWTAQCGAQVAFSGVMNQGGAACECVSVQVCECATVQWRNQILIVSDVLPMSCQMLSTHVLDVIGVGIMWEWRQYSFHLLCPVDY